MSLMKIALVPAFILTSLVAALSLIAVSISTAVAGSHEGKSGQMDIVDTAVAAGDFNTLVTAVKAAGLVETLKGDGPFTVFAPDDDAFAKIPKEDLDALIKNKEMLKKVLTYHVVAGKVMAADATKLTSAETVEGQSIKINGSTEGLKLNDNTTVIKADIETSNGVIHVIDTVLMPLLPSD
jgi:uncharacterized surface protein with fasciclin (FAS1) repeats